MVDERPTGQPGWRQLPDFSRQPLIETVCSWCPQTLDASVEVPRFLDHLERCLDATTEATRAVAVEGLMLDFPWFVLPLGRGDRKVAAAIEQRRSRLPTQAEWQTWLVGSILVPALCEAIAQRNVPQRVHDPSGRLLRINRGVHVRLDGQVVHKKPGTPFVGEPDWLPPRWFVPWLRRTARRLARKRILREQNDDALPRVKGTSHARHEVELPPRELRGHERDPESLLCAALSDADQLLADAVADTAEALAIAGLLTFIRGLPPSDRRVAEARLEDWPDYKLAEAFDDWTPERRRTRLSRLPAALRRRLA